MQDCWYDACCCLAHPQEVCWQYMPPIPCPESLCHECPVVKDHANTDMRHVMNALLWNSCASTDIMQLQEWVCMSPVIAFIDACSFVDVVCVASIVASTVK